MISGGSLLIPALGVAQIISWGTLYYSVAVLAKDIRTDLGLSTSFLFGAYTVALLASAALAPTAGRLVDRYGGRVVLGTGSVIGTTALLTLAASRGPISLVVGYLLIGVAMSFTLYEPAFATLHRLRPETYRRAVTLLTLFGGLASTVFWPTGSGLNALWGWRWTLVSYALLHLMVCLPLHYFAIPRETSLRVDEGAPERETMRASATASFYWLAAAFAFASMIFGSLSAHIIEVLTLRGMSLKEAVAIGACIGPMQVTGRLLEFALARHSRPVHIGCVAFSLMAMGMVLLATAGTNFALGVAFAMVYGMGNGIFTIVRGVTPAEILGKVGLGALLGKLARIHLPAVALSPVVFALLRDAGVPQTFLIAGLGLLACAAGACFVMAATRPNPRS